MLATFLLLSGTYWVQRLGNNWLVLLYLLLGTTGIYIASRLSERWLHQALNERVINGVALGGLLLLFVSFLFVYPRVNCQQPNCGSDRDDALRLAAGELLAGRYPYYPQTYHGNPLTPMPGAMLLAVPFQLLGNVAYQTFFWLAAFFLFVRHLMGSSRQAAVLCGLMLLSPAVLHEIMTGGDLWTNGLYVLVLGGWVLISAENNRSQLTLISAILFGISLSSRPNFILFAPLLLALIDQQHGHRLMLRLLGVIAITTLAVTLPFYAYDPAHFAPIQRTSELADLDQITPYLGSIILPLSMVLLTGMLCLPRFQRDLATTFLYAGAIQLLPTIVGSVALSLDRSELDLQLMAFGPIFIAFGALGAWMTKRQTPSVQTLI